MNRETHARRLQTAISDVIQIPARRIKAGNYDTQGFIYWDFLKCSWNEELDRESSAVTNSDWYGPSNARRFSELGVHDVVAANNMFARFFHREEACYSGRFAHR